MISWEACMDGRFSFLQDQISEINHYLGGAGTVSMQIFITPCDPIEQR